MYKKDTLTLLKISAGNNYNILSDISDDGLVDVLHRKCGNQMRLPVSQIALHGFSCSRCDALLLESFAVVAQEWKSRELYRKCMEKLPNGFSVYGSTISEENSIKVSWPMGEDFEIKISDLLEDRNLPDCLLHRDINLVPSIQLSILDMFINDEREILDDFNSLEDTIRIKNNRTGTVIAGTVKEIVKGLINEYDTYKIPNL